MSVHSHSRDLDGLCKELGNHGAKYGMTKADAADRRREEGPNELYKEAAPGFWLLFLMQLTNFIILLLIGAGAGSIIVNATSHENDSFLAYVEGLAIFIIVIINAGIAAITENSANNALKLCRRCRPRRAACCAMARTSLSRARMSCGATSLFWARGTSCRRTYVSSLRTR
jgi:magnesium-transporting ATPase (P-type)